MRKYRRGCSAARVTLPVLFCHGYYALPRAAGQCFVDRHGHCLLAAPALAARPGAAGARTASSGRGRPRHSRSAPGCRRAVRSDLSARLGDDGYLHVSTRPVRRLALQHPAVGARQAACATAKFRPQRHSRLDRLGARITPAAAGARLRGGARAAAGAAALFQRRRAAIRRVRPARRARSSDRGAGGSKLSARGFHR